MSKEIAIVPENVPMRFFRKNSWEMLFEFLDADDEPVDLTDHIVELTVRVERHSPQKVAYFSTENNTLTYESDTEVQLLKNWGDSAPAPGVYVYDVQITDPTGYVQTVLFGKLTIENNVTR